MYLSQILPAIAQGFYPEFFHFDKLPPGLETYYQNHWQRMAQLADLTPLPYQRREESDSPLLEGEGLTGRSISLAVLNSLVQQEQPISADAIAQTINEDEYDVEQVLEIWIEFLHQQQIDRETHYSLYHSSFRHWLSQGLSSQNPKS